MPVEDKNFSLMKVESVGSSDFHDEYEKRNGSRRNSKGNATVDVSLISSTRRKSHGGIAVVDSSPAPTRRTSADVLGWEKVTSANDSHAQAHQVSMQLEKQLQRHPSSRRRGSKGNALPPIESAAKYEELVAPSRKDTALADVTDEAALRRPSRRTSAPLIIPVAASEFRRNI